MAYLAVVIINVIVNPWLLIPVSMMTILFYILRVIYINTGRGFKRIEALCMLFSRMIRSVRSKWRIFCRSKSDIHPCERESSRCSHDSLFWCGSNARKRIPRIPKPQYVMLLPLHLCITMAGPVIGCGELLICFYCDIQLPATRRL